jgi:HEAT repeat protein
METKRAVAALSAEVAPELQRAAVEKLIELAPTLVGQGDVASVAEAIAGLDRLLATTQDPALLEAIDRAAAALTDQAIVRRMVTRLGEPRVPPGEREALVTAVGALAAVSVPLVIEAFVATSADLRAPYRAAIRRAGDRALESLQGRLADRTPAVAAAAAEFMGLTGSPQAVALLLPLLRHRSEVVREAALVGLAEAGGREISRPAMPALKDESVPVRAAAARAIAVGGESASTTVLVRRLEQEQDEGVQAEILRAIGRLGAREALQVLARYAEPGGPLHRRSASVRAAAIEGIARLGTPEARAALELYSRDKEPAVRQAAELALR